MLKTRDTLFRQLCCFVVVIVSFIVLQSCSQDKPVMLAYVANAANNNVQVINLENGNTLRKFYTGATPWRMTPSPDNNQLWIQHWYAETTAVLDLESHEIKQVYPYKGPGTFNNNKEQFVTFNWPLSDLHIIDAKSLNYVEKRPVEVSQIYDISARQDGKGFYMTRFDPVARGSRERYSYVLFYPYNEKQHIKTPPGSFRTGLSPTRIIKSAKEPFSITANSDSNGLSVINLLGDVRTVETCPAPKAITLSPNESLLFVACWEGQGVGKSEVVIYKTDFNQRPWPKFEKIASTSLNAGIVASRFHPNGESVYLIDQNNNRLLELNAMTLAFKKSFTTGDVPSDLALIQVAHDVPQRLAKDSATRTLLKKIITQMRDARTPFNDLAWTEVRALDKTASVIKASSDTNKELRDPGDIVELKLNNYLKGDWLRTEAENGVIRISKGGKNVSILENGRFWVTPRQELSSIIYSLPNYSIDEAIKRLAGDVQGSPYMSSGMAVDIVMEVTEGHHRYYVIGTNKEGMRVSQLWVDADTGLPTNLVDKFPVINNTSKHTADKFSGIIETKFYDFKKVGDKFLMPSELERVIDSQLVEKIKIKEVQLDLNVDDRKFDIAHLGDVRRMPEYLHVTENNIRKNAVNKVANKDMSHGNPYDHEYIHHPFQPHDPYIGNPPIAGLHLPYITDWGIHKIPIPLELQLHNLKDGGVALQYNCPEKCPDIVSGLEKIAKKYTKYVLMAPYPLMDSKIAVTAWGKIETMDDVDELRITTFIDAHKGINHH